MATNFNIGADVQSKLEKVEGEHGLGGVFKKGHGKVFITRAKKAVSEKEQRIADYRKEASRLSSMANKRVQRLEHNNLQDTPAYQSYIESGGKFGVRGKDHNELQKEVARLKRFINATTSTIKGVDTYLKTMAVNTGMKYENIKDLRAKAPKFFELASKVEQYLRTVEDIASAIGYQKIWEAINVYVRDSKVDLSDAALDVDQMIERVTDAIVEANNPTRVPLDGIDAYEVNQWFKLE